jgi:DNA-binding NtrC family response regulator
MQHGSVLVVDDERNIRMTLRTALEGLVADVREAPDGERGLEEMRRRPADVVLLDLRMPGMDGLEVLRRLRGERPATRVVVITAHGTVDAAVEAMKVGAADFLQKPFEPAQVRDLVASLLRATRPAAPAGTGTPVSGTPAGATSLADHLAAARRFARAGRAAEAETEARLAVAGAPGDPEPLFLLGVVRDLRGERLEAQSYYRAAIALRPTFEHAHRNLARSVDSLRAEPLLFGDEPLGKR